MTDSRGELQIILATCSTTASATGSGLRFECNDISIWRSLEPLEKTNQVGVRFGQQIGDRIYPQSGGR